MAITFTYDEETNLVVLIGGTSGTPATFADFVHFDRTVGTSDSSIPGADVLGGLGDCATDWFDVQGDGWSHDGVADEYDCDGSQASSSLLIKNSILTIGVTYKVIYTVKNWTENGAGDWIRAICGLNGFGTARYANGTYTEFLTCGGDTHFRTQAGADFIGSVTDITIEPVGVSGAELKAATAVAADTDLTLTYPMRPVEHKVLRLAITTAQNGGAAVSGDETVDIFGTTAVWQKLTGGSASGQKVVPIADLTHNYQVGDTVILIDISAPDTYETDTIASIAKGVSITLTNNNTNSYATDDIVGIYQTEQIDTSGSHTTFWSTVPYGQIAMLTFTGYDGTNTAKVDQPIWGVIWDLGDGQYKSNTNFSIGNGSTTTYFASLGREQFYSSDDVSVHVFVDATLTMGNYDTGSYGGVSWNVWHMTTFAAHEGFCAGGTFSMYGSHLAVRGVVNDFGFWGAITIHQSTIENLGAISGNLIFFSASESINISGQVYFVGFTACPRLGQDPDTYVDVHSHRTTQGVRLDTPGVTVNIRGPKVTGYTNDYTIFFQPNCVLNVIDPDGGVQAPLIGHASGIMTEQYPCNIHIAYKGGIDLASALIDCEYAHLVEGSDGKTYKCIADHTAVDADHEPITGTDWADYWELYDAGGGLGGDWDTGFDYKSGTAEFSQQTTDANGDMTEQLVQYKKWANPGLVLEVRNHKFTISKEGYKTLPLDNITVDDDIVWHKELQAQKQPPAPWQEGMM